MPKLSGRDALAGTTVAAYLVPQVMAYATVAGLAPVTGLWAAVPALIMYALLGGSRLLSAGPESSTALLTGTAIGLIGHGDPQRIAALAALLALIVGAACIVGGLVRAGFFADMFSYPVLVGYMAGIAILMIAGQLGKALGFVVEGDRVHHQIWFALRHLDQTHLASLIMTVTTVAILLIMLRLRPKWPMPLIAIIIATLVVVAFKLDQHGLAIIGDVPRGLPRPRLPHLEWDQFRQLLPPALGLALVAYADNVLTARAFSGGERIDNNRELIALGAANVASGMIGAMPVSSSGSRTAINAGVGAHSQWSSVITAGLVMLVLIVAAPVLHYFPMPALAGIVIYAATRLVKMGEIREIARFRTAELGLCLVAIAGVVVFDVLIGIAIAVALSILDLLRRVARPHDAVLGYAEGVPGMHDIDDYPGATVVPGLVIYRYDSPLFFGNAENFRNRAIAALDGSAQPVKWFVLNAEGIVEIDLTGIHALHALHDELHRRDVRFGIVRAKQELFDDLVAGGLIDAIGRDRVYATLPTAVEAYRRATG